MVSLVYVDWHSLPDPAGGIDVVHSFCGRLWLSAARCGSSDQSTSVQIILYANTDYIRVLLVRPTASPHYGLTLIYGLTRSRESPKGP